MPMNLGIVASGHLAAAADRYTPAVASALEIWDASYLASITSSGGRVSAITSSGSAATSLLQSTAGDKPQTGVDTQNGKNVLTFTLSNTEQLTASPGPGSQSETHFVVAKWNSSIVFSILTGGQMCLYVNASDWGMYAGSVLVGGAPDTNWHVFEMLWDNASSELLVDGVSALSGAVGPNGNSAYSLGQGLGVYFDGQFGLWSIYPSLLSAPNRATERASLAAYWGTP